MAKHWRMLPGNPEKAREMAARLGVHPLVAQLLLHRGLADPDVAARFLHPDLAHLHAPVLLPNIQAGLDRLIAALRGNERILIFGDYDVDGMTAVSLLMRLLKPLATGGILYYVPNRLEEGYGLSAEVIARAAARGVKLIVTVDCGIAGCREVEYARELGVDVIVTDHHEPGEEIPDAVAVIDPKLPGSAYPHPDLAGVGVAFKLAQALCEEGLIRQEDLWRHLDLVALGTIADVVPLVDENRILVHHGLARLARTEHPGLRALLEKVHLRDREITAGQVGFVLAPRLNATGRLGDAGHGVRLLLTDDPERARELAGLLERENQERQRIEEKVLREALALIDEQVDLGRERAIVLAAAGWHPGVIGIVASRLVEVFHRPTILIAVEGDEGRGSGRSIPGFNLYAGLARCSEFLTRFGGHEAAAGLSIERERVAGFTEAFGAVARSAITESMMEPVLRVEAEVGLIDASLALAREIARLAPHGPGNPTPVLACRDLKLVDCRGVGEDGKHLKIRVACSGAARDGIGFNLGSRLPDVTAAESLDLAFTLEENTFNGQTEVQLNLRDVACRGRAAVSARDDPA